MAGSTLTPPEDSADSRPIEPQVDPRTDPMEEYLAFRDEIDRQAATLFERYAPHLRCRRGCYYCCDAITVLPIELEALRRWRAGHGNPPPPDARGPRVDPLLPSREPDHVADRSRHGTFPVVSSPSASGPVRRCAFLGSEGECTVYDGRPTICRTHGLPLAYRVYEYDLNGSELHPDNPEYTDLFCGLNFVALDEEATPTYFDEHGRINMDAVNRRIETLNEAFLKSDAGGRYRSAAPGDERADLGILLDPDHDYASAAVPIGTIGRTVTSRS